MQEESGLAADISTLCEEARGAYSEFDRSFRQENIKRGLRNADGTGVLVGVTRVGSVQGYYVEDGERIPMPGQLFYRGIDVHDIAEHHQREGTFGFEEVAYLLLLGDLPDKTRFEMFDKVLSKARILPDQFFEDVILKVPSPDVMNMLARSVLALYSYDRNPDDLSFENLVRQSVELIGRFPSIVAHSQAVKRHVYGKLSLHIHNPLENLSVAENFLHQVRPDKVYSDAEAKLLDLMLMLHAEHGGGNNSAFVCRALSSTGTDTYSVIAGAIGSLKGPLHGGANAKVTEMLDYLRQSVKDPKDDDEVGVPSRQAPGRRGRRPFRQALRPGARGLYDVGSTHDPDQEARPGHGSREGAAGGLPPAGRHREAGHSAHPGPQESLDAPVRERGPLFRPGLRSSGDSPGTVHSTLRNREDCRVVLAPDRRGADRRTDHETGLPRPGQEGPLSVDASTVREAGADLEVRAGSEDGRVAR